MWVYFERFCFVSGCPKGLYGVACNTKCGNCRELGQCHHITGACVSGCDAGYEGALCKTREYKMDIHMLADLRIKKKS